MFNIYVLYDALGEKFGFPFMQDGFEKIYSSICE